MRFSEVGYGQMLVGLVLVLLATVNDGCGRTASSRKRTGQHSEVRRVGIYRGGNYTGYELVDLRSRRLEALAPGFGRRPDAWGLLRATITEAERDRLRNYVSQPALRTFHPQPTWFKVSSSLGPDGQEDLLIDWTGRELVLGIPPLSTYSSVPERALKLYQSIYSAVSYLMDLVAKYRETGSIEDVLPDSAIRRQFDRELDRVQNASLPERRVGW